MPNGLKTSSDRNVIIIIIKTNENNNNINDKNNTSSLKYGPNENISVKYPKMNVYLSHTL